MKKPGATVVSIQDRKRNHTLRWAKEDADFVAWGEELRKDEVPLVIALRKAGCAVTSVWDLVNTSERYPAVIPVLVQHLAKPYNARNLEGIVRALTVKEANTLAWAPLLSMFERAPAHEPEPRTAGLKGALANAVSVLANRARLPDLVRLALDRRHGGSRLFLVHAICRLGDASGLAALRELETDPDPDIAEPARKSAAKLEKRLSKSK